MTRDQAIEYAEKHIEIWNRLDVDEIVSMYAGDVEFTSPVAAEFADSTTISGRESLRSYFTAALAANQDLHFSILDVLTCPGSITLYLKGLGGRSVAEVLFLDDDGLIEKVLVHYSTSE